MDKMERKPRLLVMDIKRALGCVVTLLSKLTAPFIIEIISVILVGVGVSIWYDTGAGLAASGLLAWLSLNLPELIGHRK